MSDENQPARIAPSFFSYMNLLTNTSIIIISFFLFPLVIAVFSTILYQLNIGFYDIFTSIIKFFQFYIIFMGSLTIGSIISLLFSKKSPILKAPPKGWSVQINIIFNSIMGMVFLIGLILSFFLNNITFQEVFFILATIISYIVAYVIYFSFTTVGLFGYLSLALSQPVLSIILYSLFTAQFSFNFFIKAIIIFCSCAFIFAIPYAWRLSQVSNIYRKATGLGGYKFIRAFVLSILTQENDDSIEKLFDEVGIDSEIRIQYLAMRKVYDKKIKGLFIVPDIHFGPFKTCGSSDFPEIIYKQLEYIPGLTIYHTTNDHSKNLTTRTEVEKLVDRIKNDVKRFKKNFSNDWIKQVHDFSRDSSNSAKIIGFIVNKIPFVILTRHPLPCDDIESEIGEKIRRNAKSVNYEDIMIVDAHNSIIGDEILIKDNSSEAMDLINMTTRFLQESIISTTNKVEIAYGTARDKMAEFDPSDGIGFGGMVLHLFKNIRTQQKTALVHFDANNAFVEIRSSILNMLEKRNIEKAEITTSDSHTVARQLTRRGYSPIGDKIGKEVILEKLNKLLMDAESDLEPIEFQFYSSRKEVRIWGDLKYFSIILNTLQEAVKTSQRLLSLSLIAPTFFSIILLLFYYNIPIPDFM